MESEDARRSFGTFREGSMGRSRKLGIDLEDKIAPEKLDLNYWYWIHSVAKRTPNVAAQTS